DVAGVFHLDAAIHDDGHAAGLGDAPAFLVDHRELTPEVPGADLDRVGGNRRQRLRRAKDVDDVDGNRHIEQTGAALFAKDLGFARVHGNHAIAVSFQVVPDEIARAQL